MDVTGGVLRLSGTVQRRPGVTGELDGLVDVDLIGPDGLLLDKQPALPPAAEHRPGRREQDGHLLARPRSGTSPRSGRRCGPGTSTGRTAIRENLKEGDLDYNGNGGHIGTDVPRSQENGSMPTNPTGGGGGQAH